MANAVFIASLASRYDDVLEQQYHFPSQYLARVQQTVDDWIIYYEPRRGGGRRVYFAMAQVVRIEPDTVRAGYFYARIQGYQEFAVPVALQHEGHYLESFISNPDGTLNNGAAINAVRHLPVAEFRTICRLGLMPALNQMDGAAAVGTDIVAETQSEYGGQRRRGTSARPIRDAAFSEIVRTAYDRTCAMTGLRMTNGPTRTEVQAAHIRPVDADGPDSPRNGLALSRSIHWLFDEGFLSVEDDGRILQARRGVPDSVRRLLNADERIITPANRFAAPHVVFLRWHREHRFQG